MDTRDGTIYDSIEAAKAAGVPDEFLVAGTRKALDNLKRAVAMSQPDHSSAVTQVVAEIRGLARAIGQVSSLLQGEQRVAQPDVQEQIVMLSLWESRAHAAADRLAALGDGPEA